MSKRLLKLQPLSTGRVERIHHFQYLLHIPKLHNKKVNGQFWLFFLIFLYVQDEWHAIWLAERVLQVISISKTEARSRDSSGTVLATLRLTLLVARKSKKSTHRHGLSRPGATQAATGRILQGFSPLFLCCTRYVFSCSRIPLCRGLTFAWYLCFAVPLLGFWLSFFAFFMRVSTYKVSELFGPSSIAIY